MVLGLQLGDLAGMGNAAGPALARAPLAVPSVVLYGVTGAAACVLAGLQAWGRVRPALAKSLVALTLLLAGLFAVRFSFYMMHMTAGIGL